MSSFRKDNEPSFLDKVKGVAASGATITALPLATNAHSIASYVKNDYTKAKTPSPLYTELKRIFLTDGRFGELSSMSGSITSTKPNSWSRFAQALKEKNKPYTAASGTINNIGEVNNFNTGALAHQMGRAQRLQDVAGDNFLKRHKHLIKTRTVGNLGKSLLPLLPFAFAASSDNTQNVAALGTSALLATHLPEEIRASRIGSKLLSEAAKNTGTKLSLLKRLSAFKGIPSRVGLAATPLLGLQAYRHFTKKSSLGNRYYEGEGISGYMNPWNVANPKRLYLNRDNAVNLGIVAGTGLAGRVVGGIAGNRVGRRIGEHNVAAMKPKVPQSRVTFGPAVPMADNVNPPALKGSVSYAVNRRVIPKLKRGDRLIRSIGRLGGSRGRMIGTGLGLTLGYLGLKRKERKPSILDFNNWLKR